MPRGSLYAFGYHLFHEDREQSATYLRTTNNFPRLERDGWMVEPNVGPEGYINYVSVRHPYYEGYRVDQIRYDPPLLCQYDQKGLKRAVHAVCFKDDAWCKKNQIEMCRDTLIWGPTLLLATRKSVPIPKGRGHCRPLQQQIRYTKVSYPK